MTSGDPCNRQTHRRARQTPACQRCIAGHMGLRPRKPDDKGIRQTPDTQTRLRARTLTSTVAPLGVYTAVFCGPHNTVRPPTTSGVPNTSASPARTVTATWVVWSSSIRSSWPAGSWNVSGSPDIAAFSMFDQRSGPGSTCAHTLSSSFFFLLSSSSFRFPLSFFESGFDTQFNMSTQLHRHPHAPVSSPVSSLTIQTRLARASRRGLVIPTAVSENSNRSRSTTVHKLVDYFGAITIPGRLE